MNTETKNSETTTPAVIGELRTGAIICVKPIDGTQDLEYKALIFITEIPVHLTDEALEKSLGGTPHLLNETCHSILIRADINATANEVSEQFKNPDDMTQRVSYQSLFE